MTAVATTKDKETGQAVMSRRHLLTSGAGALGAVGITAATVGVAPPASAAGWGWSPVQFRSVDTREWGYKPEQGDGFTLDLTNDKYGNWIIQSSAIAVTYNLTVTQTEGGGYLALWKDGTPFPGTSSINWLQTGTQLANGGVVELGNSWYASLYYGGNGGRAHFIIDITGYYS